MKWEYRTIEAIKTADMANLLNELGENGWRFVWCDLDENVFVFERPKQKPITKEVREAMEGYVSGGGKIG